MEKLNFKQIEKFLLDCNGCGKRHLPLSEIHKGKSYCQSCKEKIEKCALSDEYFLKSEMKHFKAQGFWIKDPDENNIVTSCLSRKKIWRGGVSINIEDRDVLVASRHGDGKYALIKEFKENGYIQKEDGTFIEKNKVFNWGGKLYSKENVLDEIREAGREIINYTFKPKPIFRHTVELKHKQKGIPFLGFELELTMEEGSGRKATALSLIDYMIKNQMEDLIYFKSDSSIPHGFEIVSHPSTLSYWKKVDLRGFLDKAKELGMVEHDSCGLHVHVSKDALSKKEWWVVMSFLSKTANKILKLSRRDKSKTSYCKWTSNTNSGVMAALVEGKGIFDKMPPQNSDRTAAVNFQPEKSVEFRLFKSTSSVDELYASLGLVEAIIMFARKYSFMFVQDSKTSELWDEFTSFCQSSGYGSLIKFMEEKELINNKLKKKNKYLCV